MKKKSKSGWKNKQIRAKDKQICIKKTSKSGWKTANLDDKNKQICTQKKVNLDKKTSKFGWKCIIYCVPSNCSRYSNEQASTISNIAPDFFAKVPTY
jgi:hypothetical protein